MIDHREKMEADAQLILEAGLNLREGEPLVIFALVESVQFVRILARKAYKMGCSDIHMVWEDNALTRLRYENASLETFQDFPSWKSKPLEDYAKKGGNFLYLSSDDPLMLKGIDTEKIAAYSKSSGIGLREYRNYTMNDINSWCVASIPSAAWARRLFPREREEDAIDRLWDAILKASRMESNHPLEKWKDHLDNIHKKVDYLNKKRFKSLYYRSSNGTDLTIKLPRDHIWCGGRSVNSKDDFFVANIPTEEVFTLPDKYGTEGLVYSTMPLNYGGNIIDEFMLVFKEGKVVDFSAKKGQALLREYLEMDEGSSYLGEVALVPYSSPIREAGLLFMNTLFDENASCHLALGKAYPTCIKKGTSMSDEELEANGVNDSMNHEDFMIGSADLSIVGITWNDEEVQIFKDGEWAV